MTQAFVQWLDQGVTLSPKVAIHDYSAAGQGRGVIALESIEKNELLFTINRSFIMSVDNDAEFERQARQARLSAWSALIAYMIEHHNQPRWKPYFDILPTTFNTPMFWDPVEAEGLLKGSALASKIGRQDAETEYNSNVAPFLKARGVQSTVDQFHRMGSLIMSYGFDVAAKDKKEEEEEDEKEEEEEEEDDDDSIKAMVPMADMLNAHTKLCNAHLSDMGKTLEMRAIKAIPQGAQVYNTYGDLPNSDLLRRYGYVEAGGTDFDVVEVDTALMARCLEQELGIPMEPYLKALSQDSDHPFYDDSYDISRRGEADQATLIVLLQLELLATALKDKKHSESRLFRTLEAATDAETLTEAVKNTWLRILETRLQDYATELRNLPPTTDLEENQDRIEVERTKMCREILAGETRILQLSKQWIEGVELISVEALAKKCVKRPRQ